MTAIPTLLEQASALEAQLPPEPAAPAMPQGKEIAAWIDHTQLRPDATSAQVEKLCQEARQYHLLRVHQPHPYPLAVRSLAARR
jgi:hypothetical protein